METSERKVIKQKPIEKFPWTIVRTKGYDRMYAILQDAQESGAAFAVTGEAGCGKSQAIKSYTSQHPDVYHLYCSEYWNLKQFTTELLNNLGANTTSCTIAEMMSEIIFILKKKDSPLLILDEADKLNDHVIHFFITLYNKLEDHCGIILCATDFLEKRIHKGVRTNRKGYKEIYSRIGRKFIPIQQISKEDVATICLANGIEKTSDIELIINDSENDLRRVKRKVYALRKRNPLKRANQ